MPPTPKPAATCPECGTPTTHLDVRAHAATHWGADIHTHTNEFNDEVRKRYAALVAGGE